jgi:hypothetical protein
MGKLDGGDRHHPISQQSHIKKEKKTQLALSFF